MKILVTGLHGTLGPHLAHVLVREGYEIVDWEELEIEPMADMSPALDHLELDGIIHLAMGSEDWIGSLASWCHIHSKPFLFLSSVLVFGTQLSGPFSPEDTPIAEEEFGKYKIACEQAILRRNPNAQILRIGWQLNMFSTQGNNMLNQLVQQQEEKGEVRASSKWFPAASHMDDTGEVIFQLYLTRKPGIFHYDSNFQTKLSFLEMVRQINEHLKMNWNIVQDDSYEFDQRMSTDQMLGPNFDNKFSK